VGLVDRHRILNLFEIFYDKAVDDIRNVLRNPRKCKKPKPKPKPCPCYILHIFHVVQLIMFTSFFIVPLLSLSFCFQLLLSFHVIHFFHFLIVPNILSVPFVPVFLFFQLFHIILNCSFYQFSFLLSRL